MKDQDKTKDRLIEELTDMRRRVSELEELLTESTGPQFGLDETGPLHIDSSRGTQTIDLTALFTTNITSSGSFDIRGDIWATTFGKVMQSLPGPVLLVDGSGNVVVANQAFGKIDPEYELILGAPFASLFSSLLSVEKARSLIEDVFLTRKPRVASATLKIGKARMWGRMTFRSIRIMEERYILVLIEDLTSEKKRILADQKYQKSLQKARDELEERNRLLRREVAERKRTEEKLQWNETLLSQMATSSPLGYLIVDNRTDEILYFNHRFCQIWGIEHLADRMRNGQLNNNAIIPHCIPLIIDVAAFAESCKPLQDEANRSIVEDTIEFVDGRTIRRFSTQIRDEADRYLGRFYIFEDISAREKDERQVRESEERFRAIFESAQDSIFLKTRDLKYSHVNPAMERLFDKAAEELIGLTDKDLFGKEVGQHIEEIDGRVLNGEPIEEQRTKPVKGCQKTFHVVKVPMYGKAGDIVGLCGIARDVSDRHRASEQVAASRASFSSIVEATSDGVLVLDTEQRVLYANSSAISMFRRSQEDVGKVWFDRDRSLVSGEMAEIEVARPDGSPGLAEIRMESTEWEKQSAHLAMLRDVTEQRKHQEVQRRLATAIEQSAETIIITDSEGIIEYVNPAFVSRSGYTEAEVIGKRSRFRHSDEYDEEFYRQVVETVRSGKVWTGRFKSRRKDGTIYHEDATVSPVRDSSGKIVNYVAVKRDVTEELELQQHLRQAQKMEAVGTLAGGIAHDFNNLLQVVVGYGELLSAQIDKRAPYYNDLEIILKAAYRGADLVKRILTFSRQVEPDFRPVNLIHEINQTHKLLLRTIPRMIAIETQLADNLNTIRADPTQIEQILLNMAVNSRDAMPGGGRLIIEAENLFLDKDYCRTHLEVKPGHYVRLTVSDTGCGMERETVERIFDPFFTTKEAGQGTGLGLSTVFGIVKSHGGHIICYSEPGVGTTFKLDFPALEAENETDVAETAEMPAFGTETILVVDDEEDIRELAKRYLTKAGYSVLVADNGARALEIYRENQSKISLVILDLIMPKMGGKECLKELLKVNPNAKVVIASGFSPDRLTRETIKAGVKGFIDKPFRAKEMFRTIRKVLDEG